MFFSLFPQFCAFLIECDKFGKGKEMCVKFINEFSCSGNYRARLVFLEGCVNLKHTQVREEFVKMMKEQVKRLKNDPVKFVKNAACRL